MDDVPRSCLRRATSGPERLWRSRIAQSDADDSLAPCAHHEAATLKDPWRNGGVTFVWLLAVQKTAAIAARTTPPSKAHNQRDMASPSRRAELSPMMGDPHPSVESVGRAVARRGEPSSICHVRADDANGPRREPHFDCASIAKCAWCWSLLSFAAVDCAIAIQKQMTNRDDPIAAVGSFATFADAILFT
jgi:hypothetical protein